MALEFCRTAQLLGETPLSATILFPPLPTTLTLSSRLVSAFVFYRPEKKIQRAALSLPHPRTGLLWPSTLRHVPPKVQKNLLIGKAVR